MTGDREAPQVSAADLARWSASLAAIARTGLGFTENLYERERFEEVLHVAGDIKAAAARLEAPNGDPGSSTANFEIIDAFVGEWLENIGEGVPGYVTPKIAVGAVVGNEDGHILLIKRPESGVWLYPTGWADVGYSAAEVAVKEVEEETGHSLRAGQFAFGHRRTTDGVLQVRDVPAVVPLPCRRRRTPGSPARDRSGGLVRRGRSARHHRRCLMVGTHRLRRDSRRHRPRNVRPPKRPSLAHREGIVPGTIPSKLGRSGRPNL